MSKYRVIETTDEEEGTMVNKIARLSITFYATIVMTTNIVIAADPADESGVTFEYGYTSDIMMVAGVDVGANALNYLDNVDLVFGLNTGGLGLWNGGDLCVYFLSNQGAALSEVTGDAQVTSNIEADGTQRLYEFWYNQALMDGRLEVLFGLHDLNSEFYTNEAAGLFTNSSFGIGADVAGSVAVSIFNVVSPAVRVKLAPNDKLTVLGAIYDGFPDPDNNTNGLNISWDNEDEGMFAVVEGQYALSGADDPPQIYRAAFWTHSVPEPLHNHTEAISGVYFSVDQPVAGLATFAHGGLAFGGGKDAEGEDTPPGVPLYVGFGAHTLSESAGLFSNWEETLGLAVAAANIQENEKGEKAWEITVEATWAIQISDIWSVQPDVQVVLNPSGNEGNAIVYGVRTSIGF